MIRVASLMVPAIDFRPAATLRRWAAVAHQRHTLRGLDQAQLDDIGLSKAEAKAEADRPFWDAPDNWRI